MLEEHEWEQLAPLLSEAISEIKDYRVRHQASLAEATNRAFGNAALERYFELTGFRETSVTALSHHRISLLGPPCRACGKPLRTPRAKLCAECGASAGG